MKNRLPITAIINFNKDLNYSTHQIKQSLESIYFLVNEIIILLPSKPIYNKFIALFQRYTKKLIVSNEKLTTGNNLNLVLNIARNNYVMNWDLDLLMTKQLFHYIRNILFNFDIFYCTIPVLKATHPLILNKNKLKFNNSDLPILTILKYGSSIKLINSQLKLCCKIDHQFNTLQIYLNYYSYSSLKKCISIVTSIVKNTKHDEIILDLNLILLNLYLKFSRFSQQKTQISKVIVGHINSLTLKNYTIEIKIVLIEKALEILLTYYDRELYQKIINIITNQNSYFKNHRIILAVAKNTLFNNPEQARDLFKSYWQKLSKSENEKFGLKYFIDPILWQAKSFQLLGEVKKYHKLISKYQVKIKKTTFQVDNYKRN